MDGNDPETRPLSRPFTGPTPSEERSGPQLRGRRPTDLPCRQERVRHIACQRLCQPVEKLLEELFETELLLTPQQEPRQVRVPPGRRSDLAAISQSSNSVARVRLNSEGSLSAIRRRAAAPSSVLLAPRPLIAIRRTSGEGSPARRSRATIAAGVPTRPSADAAAMRPASSRSATTRSMTSTLSSSRQFPSRYTARPRRTVDSLGSIATETRASLVDWRINLGEIGVVPHSLLSAYSTMSKRSGISPHPQPSIARHHGRSGCR